MLNSYCPPRGARRRLSLAIVLALAGGTAQATDDAAPAHAHHGHHAHHQHAPDARGEALANDAERALAAGDPALALQHFENLISHTGESPVAEVGKVRAYLQLGQIREAISWATLAASEHPDYLPGLAAQAWVEDRIGHIEQAMARLQAVPRATDPALVAMSMEFYLDRYNPAAARAVYQQWQASHPDDPQLARLAARLHRVSGEPVAADKQPARWPAESWRPVHAQAGGPSSPQPGPRGNGFVIEGGKQVVTTIDAVPAAVREVWLRNGLGELRRATIKLRDEASGLVLLTPVSPFPASQSLDFGPVYTGKTAQFCVVFGFTSAVFADLAMPAITSGIVIRNLTRDADPERLQITARLGPDSGGAPVLNPAGQLIGIARARTDETPGAQVGTLNFAIPVARLEALVAGDAKKPEPVEGNAGTGVEDLYARLLPATVIIGATGD